MWLVADGLVHSQSRSVATADLCTPAVQACFSCPCLASIGSSHTNWSSASSLIFPSIHMGTVPCEHSADCGASPLKSGSALQELTADLEDEVPAPGRS